MNINEIRQNYPQYSDLTDQQIADGMYSKFYSDMDKDEFYSKIGFKTQKTSLLEDLKIGLTQAARPVVQTGATVEGLLNPDNILAIDKARKASLEKMEKWANPENKEQSFGGKVVGMVGTLPAQVAAMPLSPFDTGQTLSDAGEKSSVVQRGALIDTVGNIAGFAAPGFVGKTLVGKAVSGAAINATQDSATRAAIAHAAETEVGKKQFTPSAETAAIAAIPGAGIGAGHHLIPKMFGNKTKDISTTEDSHSVENVPFTEAEARKMSEAAVQRDKVELARKTEQLVKLEDALKDIDDPVALAEARVIREKLNQQVEGLRKRLEPEINRELDIAAREDSRPVEKTSPETDTTGRAMTREELIDAYAEEQGISRLEASKHVNSMKEASAIGDEFIPSGKNRAQTTIDEIKAEQALDETIEAKPATKETIADTIEEAIAKKLGKESSLITKGESLVEDLQAIAKEYGAVPGKDIPAIEIKENGDIGNFVIPSPMRRQGIGEALSQALDKEARQRGQGSIDLMASKSAVEFWEKMGYERTGFENTDGDVSMTKSLVQEDDVPTTLPGSRMDTDIDVVKLYNHIRQRWGVNTQNQNLAFDKRLFSEGQNAHQNRIYRIIEAFTKTLGLGKDRIAIIYDSSIKAGRLTVKGNTFVIRINPSGIMKEFDSLLSDKVVRETYEGMDHDIQSLFRQTVTVAHELGHVFFYKMSHHYWRSPAEIAQLTNKYKNFVKKNPKWMSISQYLFPEQFMGKAKYKVEAHNIDERIISFKEYFANQVAKELIYDNVKGIKRGEVLPEQGSRLAELGREEAPNSFAESQLDSTRRSIANLEERLRVAEQQERVRGVSNELISANAKETGEMPDYFYKGLDEDDVYNIKHKLQQLRLIEDRWLKELNSEKGKTKTDAEYMGQLKELDTPYRKFTGDIVRLAKGMTDFLRSVFDSLAPGVRDSDLRATTALGGDIIRNIIKRNGELEELGKTVWQELDSKNPLFKKTSYEQDKNLLTASVKDLALEFGYNHNTGKVYELAYRSPHDNLPPQSVTQAAQNLNFEDLPQVSAYLTRNLFGRRSNAGIWFDNPVVKAVNEVLNKNTQYATNIYYRLMHGDPDTVSPAGPLRSLKAAMDELSVANILKKSKAEDLHAVFDLLKRNYDIGAVESEAISKAKTSNDFAEALKLIQEEYANIKGVNQLSPEQRKIYNSLTTMWAKQHLWEVKTFLKMGKKNIPPFHPGWYPAVRSGDFYFTLLDKTGRVVHAQYFRTAELRDKVIKRFNNATQTYGIRLGDIGEVTKNTDLEASHDLLRLYGDSIDDIKGANEFIQRLQIFGGKLGKHHEFRYNIDGYMGTELFNTVEESGNAFRRGIEESVNERTSIIRKMLITHDLAPVLNNAELEKHKPNTFKTVKLAHDMVQNKVKAKSTEIDNWIDAKFEQLYLAGRKPVAIGLKKFGKAAGINKLASIDPYELPQVSTFKKAHGTAGNLFYVWALMSRPAFWAGQAMTPLTTVPRTLLRETGMVDAIDSMGKGLHLIMFGDPEFNKIARYVRDTSDTFHPQFINDFNNLGFLDKAIGEQGRKTMDWFTGQEESTMIDAWSRYYSFAVAYAHNKKKGLTGKPLIAKTIDMTGEAAVLYGRAEKAPMFQKMGTAGEMMSPLQTFAQAQLANLVADMRRAVKTRNAAPAISTFLLTMLAGGVMGTAGVAELEALMRLYNWMAPTSMRVPTVMEWVMKGDNISDRVISHGAISTSTMAITDEGLDIGSSVRWNPILGGVLQGDRTFLQMLPAISFAAETTGYLGTAIKSTFKDIPMAEKREAALALTPGGYKAITDYAKYDSDKRMFVPDKQGAAKTTQTGEKILAQALGTKTISESVENQRTYFDKIRDQEKRTKVRKNYNLAADGIQYNNPELLNRAIQDLTELGMTPQEIFEAVKAKTIQRNIPEYQRAKFGVGGGMTAARARQILEFQELE